MLVSTVLGGILSIMAQKTKDKADEQKMLMQRAEFQSQQFDDPNMPIYVGYTETIQQG
jgi:hypothetical protein